ncbi:MAG TPA: hypothetical protein VK948_07355 [Aeromicrobium sp.]|nr:hypothetical protein [Aeromicrobium sp.]
MLSASAIVLVLGISGVAVAGVLADPPAPPKTELLSNAAMMANIAGTGVGGSPGPDSSTAPADEVDVTGITFVSPDKDAKLFAMPDATSEVVASIPAKSEVGATGTTHEGFTQIAYQDKVGWVKDKQLATGRPLSVAPCASGNGVEAGLQPDTIRVHRVVCSAFPQLTRYGGRSGGGDHATGRALDIMTKDVQVGTAIAIFMREHAAELGISQVIWRQHIWTVQMAGGGWRSMDDRGSPTANHMDHVHVATYGNRGTL